MSKAFETKIYVFDTSVLQDESLFKKFYRIVPSFRQKKVDFYKDYKDKCLSLGVGLVLIKALKTTVQRVTVIMIKNNRKDITFFI